jgi:hypothetical protein
MVKGAKNFNDPPYVLAVDPYDGKMKVGYEEHHGVTFSTYYGYKTRFAYIHEHEEKKVEEEVMNAKLNFSINCGTFSYAEIPNNYDFIMGVTGTLSTLQEPEMRLL